MTRLRKYLIIILSMLAAMLCAAGVSTWIISTPKIITPLWEAAQPQQQKVYVKKIVETTPDETVTGSYLSNTANKKLEFSFEDGKDASSAIQSFDVGTANSGGAVPNVEFTNGDEIKVGCTYSVSVLDITFVSTSYSLAGTYQNGKEGGLDGIEESSSINIILKHKTVDVSGTLYTIEDALAQNGNATVKADTAFTGKSVANQVGYTSSNYTVASGETLLLPMGEDNTDFPYDTDKMQKVYTDLFSAYAGVGLFSTLTVPSGITVSVDGNLYVNGARKNVDASSTVSFTDKGYGYSQLEVNGNVNLANGARFVCYGFSYGTGAVTAKSGATVMEPLVINGWKGGSISACIYKHVFPINQFNLTNIEGKVVFEHGANYLVRACLEASNIYFDETINFLGKEEKDQDYFVVLKDDAKLTKFVDASGKVNLQSEGNVSFHNIGMTIKMGLTQTLSIPIEMTTAGIQVPIPANFVLEIKSGIAQIPNEISVKLLPGAKCIVDEGATLQVESGGSIYSYREGGFTGVFGHYVDGSWGSRNYVEVNIDSNGDGVNDTITAWQDGNNNLKYPNIANSYRGNQPTINVSTEKMIDIKGTLQIDSGATLGATIGGSEGGNMTISGNLSGTIWEDYSGSINLSDVIGEIAHITDGKNTLSTYFQATINSYGENKDGIFELTQGEYCYLQGAWHTISPYTVNYYANGDNVTGVDGDKYSKTVDFAAGIEDSDWLTKAPAPEVSREYYTFGGWYTNQNCEGEPVISADGNLVNSDVTVKGGETLDLYAKWTPIEYTIKYVSVFPEGSDGTVDYGSMPQKFTIVDGEISFTVPELSDFVFVALYSDESCAPDYQVNSPISASDLVKLLKGDTVTLYVQWRDNATKQFTITYKNETETTIPGYGAANEIIKTEEVLETDTYELLKPNNLTKEQIANGKEYSHIFRGWFLGDDESQEITSFEELKAMCSGRTEVTLVALWTAKTQVKIQGDYTDTSLDGYYKAGDEVDLSDMYTKVTAYDYDVTVPTYFGGWSVTDGTGSVTDNKYTVAANGENVTITAQRANKHTLSRDEISNTTITVTIDGTLQNENGSWYLLSEQQVKITAQANSGYENPTITISGTDVQGNNTAEVLFTMGNENRTIKATSNRSCIVEGTLITMADGTQKPVEDLTKDDIVLTFNHTTGQYEPRGLNFIAHQDDAASLHRIVNLVFSDGTTLRIVASHSLFDLTLRKYVSIEEGNITEFIGHSFNKVDVQAGQFENRAVTLVSAYITEECVRVFSPTSEMNINIVAEGLLTLSRIPYGAEELLNMFDFDENMKYDEEKMKADIKTYGVYTYDDFKDYMTYEEFINSPVPYLKVGVGKGLVTFEQIIKLLEYQKKYTE